MSRITMAANGNTTFAAPSINNYKSIIESEDITNVPRRPNANTLIKLLNDIAAGA
jgi:hypothetical protein